MLGEWATNVYSLAIYLFQFIKPRGGAVRRIYIVFHGTYKFLCAAFTNLLDKQRYFFSFGAQHSLPSSGILNSRSLIFSCIGISRVFFV